MEIRPSPRQKEEHNVEGDEIWNAGVRSVVFLACSVTARAQDAGTQESKAQAQTEAGPHHGQHANHLEWLSKELN
ncbi:MAG: hypothetical protein WBQ04_11695, partial [Candidatus Acidiferrales bacterium]